MRPPSAEGSGPGSAARPDPPPAAGRRELVPNREHPDGRALRPDDLWRGRWVRAHSIADDHLAPGPPDRWLPPGFARRVQIRAVRCPGVAAGHRRPRPDRARPGHPPGGWRGTQQPRAHAARRWQPDHPRIGRDPWRACAPRHPAAPGRADAARVPACALRAGGRRQGADGRRHHPAGRDRRADPRGAGGAQARGAGGARGEATAADAADKRVVVLSFSMQSGSFAARAAFADVKSPIIVLEHFLLPVLGMTTDAGHGFEQNLTQLTIAATDPVLSAGFPAGDLTVYARTQEMFWGVPGPGAVKIADRQGQARPLGAVRLPRGRHDGRPPGPRPPPAVLLRRPRPAAGHRRPTSTTTASSSSAPRSTGPCRASERVLRRTGSSPSPSPYASRPRGVATARAPPDRAPRPTTDQLLIRRRR